MRGEPSQSNVGRTYPRCITRPPFPPRLLTILQPFSLPSPEMMTPDDATCTNWNDYHWGYSDEMRVHRRNIIRPLSRAITDRIPVELVENFLGFLCDIRDLFNCALVCRAWQPRSRVLLYTRIDSRSRRLYESLPRLSLQCPQTRSSLALTHVLCLSQAENDSISHPAQVNYYQTLPLVLGGSMPNLRSLVFRNCLYPPYHSSFVALIEVVHLSLYDFKVSSCMDLLRIVLSLPKLRLAQGIVASNVPTAFDYASLGFAPGGAMLY